MNKKGFATSTILYTLLALFLVTISILLITLNNAGSTNKSLNEKVIENIEYGSSSMNDLEARITELENNMLTIDKIYPVGSIYISESDDTIEKVQDRFGGEWEKYSEGRTLVGVGTSTDTNGNITTYTSKSTGGNNLVSLTTNNLPSHTHTINHTHTTPSTTAKGNTSSQTYAMGSYGYYGGSNVLVNTWDIIVGGGGTTGKHYSNGEALPNGHYHSVSVTVPSMTTNSQNTTTSDTTGNGTSFDVQNPYITVYMYKRVK